MNKLLLGALSAVGLSAAAGAIMLSAGILDVSADTPHSAIVYRLIEWGRERSIERGFRDIKAPTDLSSSERVRRGAGNYAAMCVNCHLSPGVDDSEIRRGLYPTPMNLSRNADTVTDADRTAKRQFWIIKHGIKASGMPAWSKGGMEDAAIWDLVAFLGVLPSLSSEAYGRQVASSNGHAHGGRDDHAAGNSGESRHKTHSNQHGAHTH